MTEQVFLVDDQAAVRKAMKRLLASAGYDVVAYESARAFLDSGMADAAGCLVLDLEMPDMNGLALQQALAGSLLPVIFLTGHGDIGSGVRAMKAGASDFLTKPVDGAILLAAVQGALDQNRVARAEQAECDELRARLDSLTPREREVLALLVEGKLNKQIADQLGIVEKTIKVHRARVLAKMKVRSSTALVRLVDRVQRAAGDRT
ncbi:response regulator transcription factor [Janthinobacterium tructae]|jgi:RNA polymerase sigma factor (sigma-70 family)|uniref:Response regulator transcription factor n=1 Tax=Janthinobacterium tructae TaxID=2590869 RepID=A0A4Y6R8N0_9BURK|nr:response regulator [Janthinobacterium tructae]MBH1981289.1 response regulator transcription factor [Burkholderiales bacterium]MBH1993478.1 response regulator transcription factor [Burkholderiales bacterium]MBH2068238.1 response regulator transcription factor [Burkholderiales bacterium]QDG69331.1 response regulator transcription factor [Janthinobacterium tructae]